MLSQRLIARFNHQPSLINNQLMDIAIQAAQFFLSLSILVILHEFGHFLPARWFGMRVEKFYLFFDP